MTDNTDNSQPEMLVDELKVENQRLHRRIAQLEVKLVSAQHRIEALETEIKSVKVSPEDAKKKLLQLIGVDPDSLGE